MLFPSASFQRIRPSRKKPTEEHLKSGRPIGHEPASKPTPDKIDRVIEVPAIPCPDCKCELTKVVVHSQFQSDFPPIVPIVTELRVPVGVCPCWKAQIRSRQGS